MPGLDDVAIFWDYENCPVPSNGSGYSVVNNIRSIARPYGSVSSFKAYLEISEQAQKLLALRSELQSSGVSLVDCPHNSRKDVADKMIIVDMFAYALDCATPSTVVLITGDRDFAYAISILRLRRYRVVLVTLSNAHKSLTAQASVCLDWNTCALASVEASPKTSNHRKLGSSSTVQEKPRQSELPNLETDLSEICQNGGKDLLQMTGDTTRGEQSAEVYLKMTSTTPQPRQRSKERFPDSANSTLIPLSLKSSSTSTPIPGLPSLNGSGNSSPISADANNLDENRLNSPSGCHVMPSVTNNEDQRIDASSTKDVIPSILGRDEFVQPLLNGPLVPNCISQLDSAPSALFLPSILTGSSPRTRILISSKTSLEPAEPLLPRASDTPPLFPISSSSLTNPNNSSATGSLHPTSTIIPEIFRPLVKCLQTHSSNGNPRPFRGIVALDMSDRASTFARAGVMSFSQYFALAEGWGIVELGGTEDWISLRPEWRNISALTSAGSAVSAISSKPSLYTTQRWSADPVQASISSPPKPVSILAASDPQSYPAALGDNDNNFTKTKAISPSVGTSPDEPAVKESDFTVHKPSSESPSSPNSDVMPPIKSSSTSAVLAFSPSEAVQSTNESLLTAKCAKEDPQNLGTLSTTLATTEPLPTKVIDAEISTESSTLTEFVSESCAPVITSSSEKPVVHSGPVISCDLNTSAHEESATLAPAPAESVSSANAILQPQKLIPISASALEIEKASSISSSSPASVAHDSTRNTIISSLTSVTTSVPPVVPENFGVLVQCLQAYRAKGIQRPLRSLIWSHIYKDSTSYEKAGYQTFAEYSALAEEKGIIELGGSGDQAWLSLKPEWFNTCFPPFVVPPVVPENFKILVQCLQAHRSKGTVRPTRAMVSLEVSKNGTTYRKAGVTKFKHYLALAEKENIIELGGIAEAGWICLQSKWHDAVVA